MELELTGDPVTAIASGAVIDILDAAIAPTVPTASAGASPAARPENAYSTVSAIWNLAYDGGMGAGVVGFGFVAGRIGYPAAFFVTAVLMLGGMLPWQRDRGRS